MTKPTRSEGEPRDYLGALANEALKLIERANRSNPDRPDVRVVVFVENDEMCMTALGGWEDDTHAIAAVFTHLAAVFESNGQKLLIMPLGKG